MIQNKSKRGWAESGALSEPLHSTKSTSCPSLSSLKLAQVLQSQQAQPQHTLIVEGVDKELCALLFFSGCHVSKGHSCPLWALEHFKDTPVLRGSAIRELQLTSRKILPPSLRPLGKSAYSSTSYSSTSCDLRCCHSSDPQSCEFSLSLPSCYTSAALLPC